MRPDTTGGSPGLDLRVEMRGSTVEVVIGGDLDMATTFKLETRVDAVLAAEDVRAVVVDLSRVGFMDSAGLGALVHIRERAEQLGIEFSISEVSDSVRRTLETTGLGGIAG